MEYSKLKYISIISIILNLFLLSFLAWNFYKDFNKSSLNTLKINNDNIVFDNSDKLKVYFEKPFIKMHLDKLDSLIDSGTVLVVNENNRTLLNYMGHLNFVPASTLKILTSLAALHYLGPLYRFKTEFVYDKKFNLYIKGYGDPFLISEEINLITKNLYKNGIRKINSIYLDKSMFSKYVVVPGNEDTYKSYDAKNSSLAANFNTITYRRQRRNKKGLFSGDKKTPLIKYAKKILIKAEKENPSLKYVSRIHISIKNEEDSLFYFGHLFKIFCLNNKIKIMGDIKISKIPPGKKIYYTHYNSKNLMEVIQNLLLFSNNFIANQVLLSLSLLKSSPASLSRSVEFLSTFVRKKLKLNISLTEGSGLSYANKVSAVDMIKLLHYFKPYKHLLKIVKLKDKHYKNLDNELMVYAKSGGLKTVDALVGFISTIHYGEVRFVIILNQSTNNKSQILKMLIDVLS